MAGDVYTHRFLLVRLAGTWLYWVVPAGHVAIVRSITAVNQDTAARRAYVTINGLPLLGDLVPGSSGLSRDIRQTLYAGEELGAFTESDRLLTVSVTGYYFTGGPDRASLGPAFEGPPPPGF
jgi:hypothetical protein